VPVIKIQKILYIGLFVVSVLMTVLTVVASVMGNAGTQDSVFTGIWVVLILAAFVAIQVICLFTLKPKFTLYRAGFYLLHVGLVLFLAGSFIYYIAGDKLDVAVAVDPTATYSQIKRVSDDPEKTELVKLGFDMGIADFKVEKYAAEDGLPASDKYYEAALMIVPGGTREVTNVSLTVNHPYRTGGWKIYLMGYDGTTGSTVNLMLKRDPAEFVSTAGLWMVIAGGVVMCLLRKREAGEPDA
jgi:cytochrome c biogenesis protein ResB